MIAPLLLYDAPPAPNPTIPVPPSMLAEDIAKTNLAHAIISFLLLDRAAI
jgi:hypothetical protein